MWPKAALWTLLISVVCVAGVSAQDDLYTRIKPLEDAVANGTATRSQQLELATLYNRSGRNYEASKVASRLLLADPNDSAAAAVKADATRALTAMNEKNVAAAETRANASGATDADRLALANAYYDAGSYRSAADVYSRL